MSLAEVAEHLGLSVERARKILARHGIRETRGYNRDAVYAIEHVPRAGQGRRTDLHPDTPKETS